jgi:FlaA1/EpsC-like NDP-sugar epimerase
VQIVYTGLRPGEKIHEHLLGAGEVDQRPHHPLISQVPVPPIDTELVTFVLGGHDSAATLAGLCQMCEQAATHIPPQPPAPELASVTGP